MDWYTDSIIVKQLPMLLRVWAAYARLTRRSATGRIPGGSFLLRSAARLCRRSTKYCSYPVTIADRKMYFNLSDPDSIRALNTVHDPPKECRLLLGMLNEGDTFVDVGANYGAYSFLASKVVGESGRIEAIEPQPTLAELVKATLENDPENTFEVHQVACGNENAETELFVPQWSSGRASISKDYAPDATSLSSLKVRVARLDDLLQWQNWPGKVVVKIDVEGHEVSALEGAQRLIEAHHPVMLCEVNHAALQAAGSSLGNLVGILSEFGYSSFSCPDEYPNVFSADEVKKFLQSNSDILVLA